MTITVVNMRGKHKRPTFRCDRSSPVGNPFKLRNYSQAERERVCDMYEKYFHVCLNPDNAPVGFLEYLDEMLSAASKGDITLGCWCAPYRCHCDTIKAYLETEVPDYEKIEKRT